MIKKLEFEAGPEDSPYMHLAAPLLSAIAQSFNEWLADVSTKPHPAVDVAHAAVMVMGILMSEVMDQCAEPGQERRFCDVIGRHIAKEMAGYIGVKLPNASSH